MATLTDKTIFQFDKGATTQTVTLNSAATAGMTLVLVNTGGAVVTANLQTGGGTLFTKRGHAVGTEEVAVQDVTCAGGETQVVLTLSGAANCAGVIYQFASLGAFIAFGANGAGTVLASGNDFTALAAAVAVTGNAVLVSGFDILFTGTANAVNKFFGPGPAGTFYANQGHQTGTGVKHMWASGLADITAAGSWPGSQAAGSYKTGAQWLVSAGTVFAAAAAYTDTSGIPTNAANANSNVTENSLPGTVKANWYLTGTSLNDASIAGYTDKLSYAPGDTVSFKVDSTSHAFRAEIYRLGFYGYETLAARNVLGVGTGADAGYITGTVTAQGAASVDGTLGSSSCAWTANATWTVPASAQPGVYTVIFRRTDVGGHTAAAAFVVRAASAKGKIAVVVADYTWNAYNTWGATTDNGTAGAGTWTGRSLYQTGADGASGNVAHRAYAVCFDRPMGTGSFDPVTWLYDGEQPLITFLEAQGYDLVYYSNADLENDTTRTLLTTAKAVVLTGHQEYWTANIYNSLTAAADAGVPMMIQSSNTALWHTRFAAADTNKRTMICYKDSLSKDSSAGFDAGTGFDPVSYTGTWRDTRTVGGQVNNTDIRRENTLTGQLFVASGPVAKQITVPFASKAQPAWRNAAGVQALTTGNVYTVNIPGGGGGDELDSADGSAGQPPNLASLNPYAAGSITTGANANGSTYVTTVTPTCGFTLYRRYASRALIFNTGAWDGWWGVTRFAKTTFGNASVVVTPDVNWQNALLAIMYDLGCAPAAATCVQPAADTNVTSPATGAPAAPADKTAAARAYGLRCPEDGQFMAVML